MFLLALGFARWCDFLWGEKKRTKIANTVFWHKKILLCLSFSLFQRLAFKTVVVTIYILGNIAAVIYLNIDIADNEVL